MRTARTVALAAIVAATLVLSGCQNLPKRVAGARCSVVGEHAQDGTWVLKCGSNRRWTRLMTIAQANEGVANWLRSQAPAPSSPPPTTPPPPAAPTLTSFPAVDEVPVADRSGNIAPGTYWTSVAPGSVCGIEVSGGPTLRRRIADGGPMFFNLYEGMTVTAAGPCFWTRDLPGPQTMPGNGDGTYRVGSEIAPGLYTAAGSAECYWETAANADGSVEAVTDIYLGTGPQLVEILPTDEYFVSDDCGAWAPLTSLPPRFLEVASSLNNWVLQGHRAFYQGSEFTVTPGAGSTQITTPYFSVTIGAPGGGAFTTGTFDAARFPDPSEMRLDISSPGRGCNVVEGTATIADVVIGGGGEPTAMRLIALAECDGQPFGINLRY